jgi:hypothetical protein
VRGSTWLTIEKSTFSDNQIALDPTVAWNFQLLDSNIIAESGNVGNPQCNKSLPNFNCFSVDTCVDLRVMNRSSSIPARTIAAPGKNFLTKSHACDASDLLMLHVARKYSCQFFLCIVVDRAIWKISKS